MHATIIRALLACLLAEIYSLNKYVLTIPSLQWRWKSWDALVSKAVMGSLEQILILMLLTL